MSDHAIPPEITDELAMLPPSSGRDAIVAEIARIYNVPLALLTKASPERTSPMPNKPDDIVTYMRPVIDTHRSKMASTASAVGYAVLFLTTLPRELQDDPQVREMRRALIETQRALADIVTLLGEVNQ